MHSVQLALKCNRYAYLVFCYTAQWTKRQNKNEPKAFTYKCYVCLNLCFVCGRFLPFPMPDIRNCLLLLILAHPLIHMI